MIAKLTYFALQGGSNGLVAAPSQRAEWTQWQVGGGDLYEATSVNHIEMRGHPNMTAQFRNIFGRTDDLRLQ
jgi:hypothetical protein